MRLEKIGTRVLSQRAGSDNCSSGSWCISSRRGREERTKPNNTNHLEGGKKKEIFRRRERTQKRLITEALGAVSSPFFYNRSYYRSDDGADGREKKTKNITDVTREELPGREG